MADQVHRRQKSRQQNRSRGIRNNPYSTAVQTRTRGPTGVYTLPDNGTRKQEYSESVIRQSADYVPFETMAPDCTVLAYASTFDGKSHHPRCAAPGQFGQANGYPTKEQWEHKLPSKALAYQTYPLGVRGCSYHEPTLDTSNQFDDKLWDERGPALVNKPTGDWDVEYKRSIDAEDDWRNVEDPTELKKRRNLIAVRRYREQGPTQSHLGDIANGIQEDKVRQQRDQAD